MQPTLSTTHALSRQMGSGRTWHTLGFYQAVSKPYFGYFGLIRGNGGCHSRGGTMYQMPLGRKATAGGRCSASRRPVSFVRSRLTSHPYLWDSMGGGTQNEASTGVRGFGDLWGYWNKFQYPQSVMVGVQRPISTALASTRDSPLFIIFFFHKYLCGIVLIKPITTSLDAGWAEWPSMS